MKGSEEHQIDATEGIAWLVPAGGERLGVISTEWVVLSSNSDLIDVTDEHLCLRGFGCQPKEQWQAE